MSVDEWLGMPSYETRVAVGDGGEALSPDAIRALQQAAAELRIGSRAYRLEHRLLVRFDREVDWGVIGPPDPVDPRLRPTAFGTWHLMCVPQAPARRAEMLGTFALMRGSSDGFDRYRALVLQVMRTLLGANTPRGPAAGFTLLATWMSDLYRSAGEQRLGLCAEPRIYVPGRGSAAAALRHLGSTSRVVSPYAVASEGEHAAMAWFADLEPECYAASATKLEAVLRGCPEVPAEPGLQDLWREGEWYEQVVPSLSADTLRKAHSRGKPLKRRMPYRTWEYEVGSVCRVWEQHAPALRAAVAAEQLKRSGA